MYVGGQNGVDAQGRVVSDRVGPQAEQALRNLLVVLDAAGATQDDMAKLTVHVVAGADIREAFPPRNGSGAITAPPSPFSW